MQKTVILNHKSKKNIALISLFSILASCGGGGGSSGGSPGSLADNPNNDPSTLPTNPTPPTQTFDQLKTQYENNYEYSRQWGLATINASAAYARGATGSGITIGITDSGLDSTHDEISFTRLSPESNLSYSNYTPNTRQQRHGTMVSSVAAGSLSENDDSPMHGVAFNSNILFTAIQLAEPDENYDPVDLGDSSGNNAPDFTGIDNFFSELFEIYNVADVDIVNNSYGYSGNINDYNETQIRNAFPKTIEEMAQADTPDSEKTIYVWAAGNAGSYADQGVDYSSPELLPGMSVYVSEIQSHSIAVVAIDESGEISDFSNRCGIAADFCIAAPGGSITVAYPVTEADQGIYEDDDYDCETTNNCFAVANGTSFASPFVAGGLAVIADFFSGQLGATEIVQRMLSTANKTGVYADAEIYGQGLLDLDAATSPVGQLSATLSGTLDSVRIPWLDNSLNISNIAIGDALRSNSQNVSLILFDELDAPFRVSLGSFINNEAMSAGRFSSLTSNLKTVNRFSTNETGSLKMQFKTRKFSNLGTFNYAYEEALMDQYSAFSYVSNDQGIYISSGMNFDSELGIKTNKKLNYSLKALLDNPWSSFTEKGLSFGKSFQFNQGSIGIMTSFGKNSSMDPFDSESSNNQGMIVDFSNKSKNLGLQIGKLNEKGSFNGIASSGMFNTNKSSITNFAGINFAHENSLGYWVGSFYHGSNPGKQLNGIMNKISKSNSNAFTLGYQPKFKNSARKLVFSVSQPLKVTKGQLELQLPAFRTPNKNVLMSSHSLNMAPESKEIHSKITYEQNLEVGFISGVIGYRSNPFHSNRFKDYWYANLSFTKTF